VTRVDVDFFADFSLDVRDIDQSIASGNNNAALQIYLNGRHSQQQTIGGLLKLSELSTDLADESITESSPAFLLQLYGLAGRDSSKLSVNNAYADSYIRSSIQNGLSTSSIGILILNVWMYAADTLYKGVNTCQKRMEADNPSQFDIGGNSGLDDFIALWIGSRQTHGSGEGYSLYALAEKADRLFAASEEDSNFPSTANNALAEAAVNQQLKLLYQEGASIFSIPDACSKTNIDTPKKLWSVISRMIIQMHIPLIRMLIISILEKDASATYLYSTAIIPQAAQCRPSTFDRLKEELLDGIPNFQRTEFILKDLEEIYSCFGITCGDIGVVDKMKNYETFDVPICSGTDDKTPMALYQPSTNVHPIAKIDLDVLQIRILTSLGSFDYAKFWYLYGRNSPRQRDNENDPYDYYSLSELAVSTSRRNAEPYYSAFISYHNDPNYADILIRNTLNGVGKWNINKSSEQRSGIITEASSFLVLYLHLIAQINDAVNNCRDVDQDGSYDLTHPWDEVAALIIGSLEGTEEGGSSNVQDGQMIWGLSSRRAYEFQTLNRQRSYPLVNSELEDLLFAGRGEIDALECDMLEKTADSIKSITLIPLMQSVLKYAALNDNHAADSSSVDMALGEVFALAIIPILQMTDPASALILEENMLVRQGIKPVRGGAQQIADALGSAANSLGISPSSLGSIPDADPCLLYGCSSSLIIQSYIVSSIACLGITFVLFI